MPLSQTSRLMRGLGADQSIYVFLRDVMAFNGDLYYLNILNKSISNECRL